MKEVVVLILSPWWICFLTGLKVLVARVRQANVVLVLANASVLQRYANVTGGLCVMWASGVAVFKVGELDVWLYKRGP
ncbi:hypothetical protein PC128_g277 [Phytophthora cactorum]|nr:hypothetical protein PC120_g1073 [Phytophthora cactorum]KAG3207185.1 hypothetical protein PC128_g277 [Phytophthora cactorum]KAG4064505.1 hypothetical protein PC123_g786 [Phytophthora cactorum]